MTTITIGSLFIGLLLLLIFAGLPVGVSLGVIGFAGIVLIQGLEPALGTLGTVPFSSVSNYLWTTVPLFVLMGHFAFKGGLVGEIYAMARAWLSRLPGGLSVASTLGCAGFSAATGSSVACAATMGKVALPEMSRAGYSPALSSGTLAAAGTLGSLIPPSNFMIVYGMMTETPIGKLFVAGVIPGLISALCYMGIAVGWAILRPSDAPMVRDQPSWQERFASLRGSLGLIIVALVVLGGIYMGVFTPTEAGAVGAVTTFFLAVGKGRMNRQVFVECLTESVRTTSTLFVIVVGAMLFASFLAVTRIPAELGQYIIDSNMSPALVITACLVLFLFLGCLMEPIGMMLLTLPIIYPTLKSMGVDPIWFGILVIKISEIGLMTPPIGLNVYVINGVAPEIPLHTIFRGIVPFVLMDMAVLGLLFFLPALSIWLPSLM